MSSWRRVSRILGSALAGVVGFAFGYYAGLFAVLSIWGLGAASVWFPVLTVGLGSLFAGAAIAITVRPSARVVAVITAIGLGAILVVSAVAIDAALEVIVVGGMALVLATSLVARSRPSNTLFT